MKHRSNVTRIHGAGCPHCPPESKDGPPFLLAHMGPGATEWCPLSKYAELGGAETAAVELVQCGMLAVLGRVAILRGDRLVQELLPEPPKRHG